ncbi:MAG: hypothetical protein Q8P56_04670 [Candidatus Uhrbacteria bacterium]|nr:hypothetical protein [Candidatus Uhrbacteria bacterium]
MKFFIGQCLVIVMVAFALFLTVTDRIDAASVLEKLKGRILLQVQEKGEAWYVRPDTGTRDLLGRTSEAIGAMRSLGLGITNANLAKIPMGIVTPEMTQYSGVLGKTNAGAASIQHCTSDLFVG